MRIPTRYQYFMLALPWSCGFIFVVSFINSSGREDRLLVRNKIGLRIGLLGAVFFVIMPGLGRNLFGVPLFNAGSEYGWLSLVYLYAVNTFISLELIRLQERMLTE